MSFNAIRENKILAEISWFTVIAYHIGKDIWLGWTEMRVNWSLVQSNHLDLFISG